MRRLSKYDSFLIGKSNDQLVQMYGAAGELPKNHLVISPTVSLAEDRSFDLSVKKQTHTLRINESSGLIIKNQLSHKSEVHNYGILSRMFFSGAVRYQPGNKGKIFRVCEETIECETLKDNTIFDIFFSWDGMIGTNSSSGGANFDISLTAAWEDELKILSKMDGILYLGAKTCKGRSHLTNNLVKKRGTRVTFVVHYEINLGAFTDSKSVSEVHFQKPENNFFKIITK
jgi:hypothetical protein